MNSSHVTVTYSWTAHPGKLDELANIYADVTAQMEANEPGAEEVQVHVSESEGRLYVRDEFTDAGAVGFHLGTTAAAHFQDLLAVATPGTFLFLGEIPDDIKVATAEIGLPAEFATSVAGFQRSSTRLTSSSEERVDRDVAFPDFLAGPATVGTEISVTGKWVPSKQGSRFRTTEESTEMLAEWEDIHTGARSHSGVVSTEINHAVGEDAVLVHHVFTDADAMVDYFASTATKHFQALTSVATPQLHLVRGNDIPGSARDAISSKGVPVAFGEHIYGYVKHDNRQPDPETAVQVTAKWTNTDGSDLEELKYWWQRVGTDAYDMEDGLVRFEAYDVIDEDALIIHETFATNADLKFHLTKGTAAKYKKEIDQIAVPANYYFRGPVSWSIRTYSKFMHLPATYSSRGSHHTRPEGTNSDGHTI